MASIRERHGRKGISYSVLYREKDSQRSRTFQDLASARQHADRIERLGVEAADRIYEATHRPDPEVVPTVAEQAERHIAALSGVQPYTIATYRTMARQLAVTALGAMPVDRATREDVAGWIRTQEAAGVAAKTIKNRHALLSAALTRAVDDGTATRNVAARARIARTERREMTFLTPAEFQIVLGRATPYYRPLLMLLFGTGLRLGEATALRVSDIHPEFTPATLTVSRAWKKGGGYGAPKTAAGRRTIAIPGPVMEAIGPLLDREPGELLFVNTAGRRVQQATLHDLWQGWITDWIFDRGTGERTRRSPSLGKVPRIHDLRHSHAAFMIGTGMSLYDLKQRLGHESIQTTADTYGHLMPEAQVQAERAAALAFPVAPIAIES
ncbi:tyrosine-type recombinase/integrase [Cellulomonas rhizosphaerae]|nr:site-specific integrase [Cellulomonas rhizosphaerae]